jgi:hypothetical protein
MAFFNERVAQKLLGADNVPQDVIPATHWGFGASDRADWDAKVRYAQATGNCAVGVGWGACIPFGHGGPGEFRERLLEAGEKHRISEYETSVKKEVRRDPHFYRHFDYPVHGPQDLDKIVLPDPDDPARYLGLADEAAYYRQHDLIAFANLNGFFSGLHYFLYPYDDLLVDLLLEPDFVQAMLERLGPWNLRAADHLLQCGVDVIAFCDDLGSGQSLLMNPNLYRRFFLPWHTRLAELCHRYGALVHMHSHGNINEIMPDLYDAGIDLLNPNDPEEGMDLPALKRAYGDRMTFVGGLNKTFFDWDFPRQEAHVRRLGKETSGGFILMDAGGVPEGVTPAQFARVRALFGEVKQGV